MQVVDIRNGQKGFLFEERRQNDVVVQLVKWKCGYIEVFNAKYTKIAK